MKDRHVFSDDCDYFVSTTMRGARGMQKRMYGEIPVDEEDWYQMADHVDFRIWIDDTGEVAEHYLGVLVVGTIRDWVENYGPGFLCSTEF